MPAPLPHLPVELLLRNAYDELQIAQYERIEDTDGIAAACVCDPGDPCPAHRTLWIMQEIYVFLTGEFPPPSRGSSDQ